MHAVLLESVKAIERPKENIARLKKEKKLTVKPKIVVGMA
jgi:hypothetical protein